MAPVLVPITFGIAGAILIESGLSLLGLGSPPDTPSWGSLLNRGRENFETMWWLIVFPGLAIFSTVLAYNLIGEALQEATDPRLREGTK
jgi:peptide/nickel transport system permease protein